MHRPDFRRGLAALCLSIVAGCGDSGDSFPREAVSGTVTLDGRPLKDGNIQFLPNSTGSPDATTSGGVVREGKYEIPKSQGPTPGQYSVVIISGGGSQGMPAPDEMPGVLPKQAKGKIPARYNTSTKLTAEIKPGQSDPVDFALTTK